MLNIFARKNLAYTFSEHGMHDFCFRLLNQRKQFSLHTTSVKTCSTKLLPSIVAPSGIFQQNLDKKYLRVLSRKFVSIDTRLCSHQWVLPRMEEDAIMKEDRAGNAMTSSIKLRISADTTILDQYAPRELHSNQRRKSLWYTSSARSGVSENIFLLPCRAFYER